MPLNNTRPRLPIRLGSEILIEISNLNLRIKSVLVGMEHCQYILAKIFQKDLIGNFRSEMVKESPIRIMYLHNDIVYRFETAILNVVSKPARLFFFDYPKKIEKLGLRKKNRHACTVPAQTMLGNDIVEMVILDLNNDGCLCDIKTDTEKGKKLYGQMQVNKKIDIIVHSPITNERMDLAGIIRNISKDVDRIKLGIMFDAVEPAARKKVADFVAAVQEARDKG